MTASSRVPPLVAVCRGALLLAGVLGVACVKLPPRRYCDATRSRVSGADLCYNASTPGALPRCCAQVNLTCYSSSAQADGLCLAAPLAGWGGASVSWPDLSTRKQKNRTTLVVAGMFFPSEESGMAAASSMAVANINERLDLLPTVRTLPVVSIHSSVRAQPSFAQLSTVPPGHRCHHNGQLAMTARQVKLKMHLVDVGPLRNEKDATLRMMSTYALAEKVTKIGAVAAAGPSFSSECTLLAPHLNLKQVLIMSPAATNADLSNKTVFPSFARTTPSDALQSKALASIALKYKWRTVRPRPFVRSLVPSFLAERIASSDSVRSFPPGRLRRWDANQL